ncbi:MAG: efflux RND transporter periplasmic adaptor subunit [Bacteroidales bacterium]|nr:efflux RND transporter periplasmic adaptor subunit [Bacteroidales bacterium]
MKRIIFAITLTTIIGSCSEKKENIAATSLPIEVAHPVIQEVTLTREYPGYLDADATVAIVGRVNGTLEGSYYTAGQRVKKDNILFIIEPTLYKDAVKQAEAALQTAKANLEYAENNYERMKIAIKRNAVSQIELLQAQTNVETGKAAVSNAEAQLSTAKTNLGYCYIKAPHDGLMSLSTLSTGSYIAGAVSPVTLATLYKDDIMYAYFDITDNEWLQRQKRGKVEQDDYITFNLGGDNYFRRKAKMDYLSPNVELSTGTLRVRAELKNNDGFLKAGSYISVILPYKKVEDGILIKDASIGTDQLGKFIYIVNNSDIAEYRHIETGDVVNDSMRLVTSGLKKDERYVTKGLMKVRNGMKVTPIMEKEQ